MQQAGHIPASIDEGMIVLRDLAWFCLYWRNTDLGLERENWLTFVNEVMNIRAP